VTPFSQMFDRVLCERHFLQNLFAMMKQLFSCLGENEFLALPIK